LEGTVTMTLYLWYEAEGLVGRNGDHDCVSVV
jgi:hypothetical protein